MIAVSQTSSIPDELFLFCLSNSTIKKQSILEYKIQ